MGQHFFRIAGHTLCVENRNDYAVSSLLPSLAPFKVESAASDAVCSIVFDDAFVRRAIDHEVGQFDNVDCKYGVYVLEGGGFQFDLTTVAGVHCMTMQADHDFSHVHVAAVAGERSQRAYGLNNAMMLSFAFATVDKATLLMHSSVVLKGGRAYMFLGKSGTGKSTHTRLWRENIPCCSILNDDNPVLRHVGGRTMAYGTPWSGKNPVYRPLGAEVGGIVLLHQAPRNTIERLNVIGSMAAMLPAVSNMRWDKRVNDSVIDTLSQVLGSTPVYTMDCLPDGEAAWTSYRAMTKQDACEP